MRISHRDLEAARSDPRAWARSSDTPEPRRYSRYGLLLNSITCYHRSRDLDEAMRYLRDGYVRNFKRPEFLDMLENRLSTYVEDYLALDGATVLWRVRVSHEIASDLELRGEIPRVDLRTDGKYAAWLFSQEPTEWRNQLRMPLIQEFVSELYAVHLSDVTVGFYCFALRSYESACYGGAALRRARQGAAEIAAQLRE